MLFDGTIDNANSILLLQWMGVVGCVWPSSCKVSLILLPSLVFKNNAPNSVSSGDAATKGRVVQSV